MFWLISLSVILVASLLGVFVGMCVGMHWAFQMMVTVVFAHFLRQGLSKEAASRETRSYCGLDNELGDWGDLRSARRLAKEMGLFERGKRVEKP